MPRALRLVVGLLLLCASVVSAGSDDEDKESTKSDKTADYRDKDEKLEDNGSAVPTSPANVRSRSRSRERRRFPQTLKEWQRLTMESQRLLAAGGQQGVAAEDVVDPARLLDLGWEWTPPGPPEKFVLRRVLGWGSSSASGHSGIGDPASTTTIATTTAANSVASSSSAAVPALISATVEEGAAALLAAAANGDGPPCVLPTANAEPDEHDVVHVDSQESATSGERYHRFSEFCVRPDLCEAFGECVCREREMAWQREAAAACYDWCARSSDPTAPCVCADTRRAIIRDKAAMRRPQQ